MDVEPMLRHRPCREVGTGTERGRATNRGGEPPPSFYANQATHRLSDTYYHQQTCIELNLPPP